MESIGGFVIHGNNADTLARSLASLRPAVSHLVVIDSCSTDGSAELSRAVADRVEQLPWQGYGAARALAARLLQEAQVGWGFFIDSDEWLPDEQVSRLREGVARLGSSQKPHRVSRKNYDFPPVGAPYVFYTDQRVRLFRPSQNPWSPRQIVHEAFPPGRYSLLDVEVGHCFVDGATSGPSREQRQRLYALLWAVQHSEGPRVRVPPRLAWLAQVLRDGVGRGAFWRGGRRALQVASSLAEYSSMKHQLLADCRAGRHDDLLALYREGQLTRLFELANEKLGRKAQAVAPA